MGVFCRNAMRIRRAIRHKRIRGSFMAIAVGLPCGGSMICGTRKGLGTSKEGVLKF